MTTPCNETGRCAACCTYTAWFLAALLLYFALWNATKLPFLGFDAMTDVTYNATYCGGQQGAGWTWAEGGRGWHDTGAPWAANNSANGTDLSASSVFGSAAASPVDPRCFGLEMQTNLRASSGYRAFKVCTQYSVQETTVWWIRESEWYGGACGGLERASSMWRCVCVRLSCGGRCCSRERVV